MRRYSSSVKARRVSLRTLLVRLEHEPPVRSPLTNPGARPPAREAPKLVVDATGVGASVVDLLRAEGLDPYDVIITGCDESHRGRVPKRELVSTVAVLLQSGRLKIAEELPHAKTLRRIAELAFVDL